MSLAPRSTTPNGRDQQQLWRKHFPIDTDAEAKHSRRSFCTGVAISGSAMAGGQMALNATRPAAPPSGWIDYPPQTLEPNFNDLDNGEAFLFHYPDRQSPCLFVRLSETEAVAFSQKCTHLACPVIPEVDNSRFHCPCHHGAFDIRTGEPTAGPPRRALPKVLFEKSVDGVITVNGVRMGA